MAGSVRLGRWRDGFENEEDKQTFIENVLEQTEGEERHFCGNQLTSRVIELILPAADQKILTRFRCLDHRPQAGLRRPLHVSCAGEAAHHPNLPCKR